MVWASGVCRASSLVRCELRRVGGMVKDLGTYTQGAGQATSGIGGHGRFRPSIMTCAMLSYPVSTTISLRSPCLRCKTNLKKAADHCNRVSTSTPTKPRFNPLIGHQDISMKLSSLPFIAQAEDTVRLQTSESEPSAFKSETEGLTSQATSANASQRQPQHHP